ncbi:glycosyltransferase family 39 protein [Nocardioides sp. GXQ0305]|uniref:glycosyltransferase family 39 protein n=1 Tax=Nocardioides sp. GXQ0305 TaxID=3423912 RepID=UPI003D7D6085
MPDRKPSPASRFRGLDPWGPLLAAVASVVFLLHGFGGVLTRDLALYAYGGQQFAEGVPPFVAVLNRAGPLAHMVPGVGTWVGRLLGADSGYDDLIAMRILMMVLSVIAVWVVYLMARDAFGSRVAGVAAATSLLAFQGFVTYATGGPREKTTVMLLMALALWAVVHRRWGWAGVATALATLTWQPVFFGALGAVVAGALLVRGGRGTLVALTRYAVGGIVTTLAFVVYYVLVDALKEFWDAFYLINATYTRQTGLLRYLADEPAEIFEGFGWSLWLILCGLGAMVVLGAVRLRRLDRDDPYAVAVVALGGGTLVSLLWSFNVFNGWADAVFALPLAAAGLGGLVHAVASRVPARGGVAVATAYAVLVTVAGGVNAWTTRDDRLEPMAEVNEQVLEVVGPDATVMSIGSPQPLVFGRLENPIYHQMFIGGLYEYVDDTWPGGLDGLAADIEEDRPTIITMDHPTWYHFVRPVLDEHYEDLGTTYLETWYVDSSIDEEQLAELREIVGRELPD